MCLFAAGAIYLHAGSDWIFQLPSKVKALKKIHKRKLCDGKVLYVLSACTCEHNMNTVLMCLCVFLLIQYFTQHGDIVTCAFGVDISPTARRPSL